MNESLGKLFQMMANGLGVIAGVLLFLVMISGKDRKFPWCVALAVGLGCGDVYGQALSSSGSGTALQIMYQRPVAGYSVSARFQHSGSGSVVLLREPELLVVYSLQGQNFQIFQPYMSTYWMPGTTFGSGVVLSGTMREVTVSVFRGTPTVVMVYVNGVWRASCSVNGPNTLSSSPELLQAFGSSDSVAGASMPSSGAYSVSSLKVYSAPLGGTGGSVQSWFASSQTSSSSLSAVFCFDNVDNAGYGVVVNHAVTGAGPDAVYTTVSNVVMGYGTSFSQVGGDTSLGIHPRVVDSRAAHAAPAPPSCNVTQGQAQAIYDAMGPRVSAADGAAASTLANSNNITLVNGNTSHARDAELDSLAASAAVAQTNVHSAWTSALSALNSGDYCGVEPFAIIADNNATTATNAAASSDARYASVAGAFGADVGCENKCGPCAAFPLYTHGYMLCDLDGDGLVNGNDLDDDGDGIPDNCDCSWYNDNGYNCEVGSCVTTSDYDGDDLRNACDLDWDNDGVEDALQCPRIASRIACGTDPMDDACQPCGDFDGDGQLNNVDTFFDVDLDGCADQYDLDSPGANDSGSVSDGTGRRNMSACFLSSSAVKLCTRALYRDYDGDGITNEVDTNPCGDGNGQNAFTVGCLLTTTVDGSVVIPWNTCAGAINAASNCSGCPDAEAVAAEDLCARLGETTGDDWVGHPDALCDYDFDGCANKNDSAPCDPAKACKCQIDFRPRIGVVKVALMRWLFGSGSPQFGLVSAIPVPSGLPSYTMHVTQSEIGLDFTGVFAPVIKPVTEYSQLNAAIDLGFAFLWYSVLAFTGYGVFRGVYLQLNNL